MEQLLIKKVRKDLDSRNAVIKDLYFNDKLRKSVTSYVFKNGGSKTDVDDLMTYGIMSFIKQCYRPLFELKNPVEAYIFSIIKYEWMKRNKSKMKLVDEDHRPELSENDTVIDSLINDEKMDALRIAMTKLDDKCRKVLTMWASNLKMREIAQQMNYKSDGMARKKKHECLGKLKQLTKDI